jgi:hypothetical protein
MNDEELQHKIESDMPIDGIIETDDVVAYRQVFTALKKQPHFTLPDNFADKVVQKAAMKKDVKDYVWLGAGIFFLLLAFGYTIYLTGFNFDLGFLKHMAGYKGLFLFGVMFITLLHWIDKRIIRPNH